MNPPRRTTRIEFFQWTVEAHNHVNEALGKPGVSLEEARRLNPFPYSEAGATRI